MARATHPIKEVESALTYAEFRGWQIKVGGSHAWGRMYCPLNDKTCRGGVFCIVGVWSTPKNPTSHARELRRVVDNCTALRRLRVLLRIQGATMACIFTLSYRLAAHDCDQDELLERLGAAGCTDALIGLGVSGQLTLLFHREASDPDLAMLGALEDVRRTIPSAKLIQAQAECELTPAFKRELGALLA
ncbi:MAG: hypothetical protein ACEQSK_17570 [Sphingomonadaceae bacterium]